MTKHALRFAIVLVALSFTAATVPPGKAEDVGLSSERLKRVNQLLQRAIDAQEISGGITMVARRGRLVHFEAQGLMDIEAKTAMRKDAIFRIASMSKPITGVAIMILLEEGAVRLTDPVSRFIPEFKGTQVAIAKAARPGPPAAAGAPPRAPEIYLVPADREITIRDLLTHTSGLESGGPGTREGARLAPRTSTQNLATYVPKLGAVPLDFQPGTRWQYSALAGIETLGRIVEVASGQTFDRFLQDRLFAPLGMKDTAFVVSPDRRPRVVTLYNRTPAGLNRAEPQVPAWLDTTTLFSGGGGLWSTAEDYLQFAQMLVNGGELNGHRLLSPRTVDLMASNHVADLYTGTTGQVQGMGFGLTVDVVVDQIKAGARRSNGSFGWGGAFGTIFWVDRKEQLVALMMIQTPSAPLRRDFENAVMQAIVD